MIGFIDTYWQLQSIMTFHNQWVSNCKTRSIPYWTTSVFSSTVTTDERRIPADTFSCLERRLSHDWVLEVKVKVTLRLTVRQSISQSVLVSGPIWGSWQDIYYCLTVTVLLLWVALSDERTGLSFVRVIVCSIKSFIFYVFAEQSKAVAYCRQPASTVTPGIEPRWD
jgi:hypothetical protein